MNIMITGGAGYIGSVLVSKLAQMPSVQTIVVYDNLSRGNYNLFFGAQDYAGKVKFIKGDVLDARTLSQQLQGIDTVFHLAANVSTPFASQNPHFFEQVNHWGTADLVYAVEQSSVKNFVFTSSISIYGSSNKLIDEQYPPNPKTYYGISKLRGEEHVTRLLRKSDLKTYILRCGNVYGFAPSIRFDAVINRFLFEANFLNKISIDGTGHQFRSFIHVDHLVHYLREILRHTDIPPGIYNLTEKNLSVLEIAETIKTVYPDTDMQFINQHMPMREIKADTDLQIFEFLDRLPERSLAEEFGAFKEQFLF